VHEALQIVPTCGVVVPPASHAAAANAPRALPAAWAAAPRRRGAGTPAVKAMRLLAPGAPLTLTEVSLPPPSGHELLLAVQACGVCRTDLHLLDGELPAIPFPVTPGHEIVGVIAALGPQVTQFRIGDRVG